MADMKKAVKSALTAVGIGAGLYFASGAIIYNGVLSRKALNRAPEERLNEPDNMRKYLTNEEFRKGDDWFIANNPEDTLLVNDKGETLHANIIPAEKPSDVWAVVVHGYTSRPRNMSIQGQHFSEMGYNVLFPILRGHSTSEANGCSMGLREKDEVISWIDYIVSLNPNAKIVILGVSMGSATTMLVTGEKLPENVKCAVADCGYTSCWEEFSVQIGELLHLPVFPFLYAANTYSKLVAHWNFKDCKPVEAVAKSVTPTLFIHGDKDTFVPYWMMDVVYDHCSALKDKVTIPDAQHAEACEVNPELYWSSVNKFLKKYL